MTRSCDIDFLGVLAVVVAQPCLQWHVDSGRRIVEVGVYGHDDGLSRICAGNRA